MLRCLPFFLLFLSFTTHAQKLLRGAVVDAATNAPIPKASVFLNNTSVGTTADNEGRFQLNLPAGKFELIVSSIGYQTHNQPINTANASDTLTIRMQIKAPDLEAVVIEPFEKDGWEKWGRWFTEIFIGTSEYGRDTKLKNPDVLKFRHSKKDNLLTVVATAPLQIENEGLGYRITYQLENFRYDFKTRYLWYAGYPFFENLKGSDRRQRKWEKAREEVYYGSLLQFMRAVYRNRLPEEGFELHRLRKVPNAEKSRVKSVYQKNIRKSASGAVYEIINRDSAEYYNRILRQNDYVNIIGKDLLPGDSLAYAVDSLTAGLDFPDYLLVIYKNKRVPSEFKQLFPDGNEMPVSELTLINGRPIEITANGSYYSPEDLLSTGFWAWWEKMGTMLPFDYRPPVK